LGLVERGIEGFELAELYRAFVPDPGDGSSEHA
jgi:hypothetical protein